MRKIAGLFLLCSLFVGVCVAQQWGEGWTGRPIKSNRQGVSGLNVLRTTGSGTVPKTVCPDIIVLTRTSTQATDTLVFPGGCVSATSIFLACPSENEDSSFSAGTESFNVFAVKDTLFVESSTSGPDVFWIWRVE